MDTDTITAISTPPGEGALGIVRISGPQALQILEKVFSPSSSIPISGIKSHTVHHGYIKDSNGMPEDEVLVTIMRAPHSYTTEDVIEISGHGNPIVLARIIDRVIQGGARPAEPGEFTKRAFLKGRIDLAQAEAVAELINAKTEEASKNALKHISADLSREIKNLQDTLKELVITLEANIDFPEENTDKVDYNLLQKRLNKTLTSLKELTETYSQGRIIREGIITAIVGKANVGKSSLFNILVNSKNRVLVTSTPGTTRDTIEEDVNIRGRLFRLMDTAGLRTPRGRVEKESLELTRSRLKEAFCNIFILDGSKPLTNRDLEIGKEAFKKPTIMVINKIDLPLKISINKIKENFPRNRFLHISCKENTGIEELKETLGGFSKRLYNTQPSGLIITNLRHKRLLEETGSCIKNALIALERGLSLEFIASDLHHALETLQEITGEHVSEHILNEIFSKFCIGK